MKNSFGNLNENEHIALDFRPHWWYFSHHIFTGIPLALFGAFSFWLGDGWLGTGMRYVFYVLLAAWLLWLGLKFLSWRFTDFMVSDQRVVYRTGVLARHGAEIPLSRITNINFDQTVWTRMIGAGTLIIESAGREGNTTFTDIRHPDSVQHVVYAQMDISENNSAERIGRAVAAGQDSSSPKTSVSSEISALAALRDSGDITEEEFSKQKAKLLGD